MSITLFCLVKGNTTTNAFPVHIDKGQFVGDLKKVTKADQPQTFANVDDKDIKLWKVTIPDDRDDLLDNLSLQDQVELLTTREIGDYWTEKPPKRHIHVLVEPPETTAILSSEQELLDRIALLEESLKDKKPVYCQPPTVESSKRQRSVDKEQERSVKKMKQYPSPSSLALTNFIRQCQDKEQAFLIGRPYNCVGTPLVLYNSVFSDFKRYYNDEKLPMDEEHYRWTLEIIKLMADFYTIESDRQQELHDQLRILFKQTVAVIQLEDKSSNDGVLTLNFYSHSVLYLLIEINNEVGSGKCDPTIQAAASYAKYYTQNKNERLLKGCNMPCFIIALAGPWICVLGAVYAEKPVIEPLTGFEPLIHINDRTHIKKIARLFNALHLGSDKLKSYYNSLSHATVNNEDPQRFYPYLRKADNVGEFFYTEKPFSDKLLWKAETKEGQQIVVKYTHRYNKDAHELCSKIGKAPKLLHVEMMACGFYCVVMEYIEGKKLRDCDLKRPEYDKVIKDIEEAVSLLHSRDIVFADLRDSNILVIKDENKGCRGMLVDFDWAGVNNVDRYPSFMNPDINWPAEAQDEMPLKKEHDTYWLNYWREVYLAGYVDVIN